MSILLQSAILSHMASGNIDIAHFNPARLNANSYDLTLGGKMLVLAPNSRVLDPKRDLSANYMSVVTETDQDGQEYFTLWPSQLYLGVTQEWTNTRGLVPIMEGKSSLARMGVSVHKCAGFGDDGFAGHWTLEIEVSRPIRLYVGMPIGQLVYHTIEGESTAEYQNSGSYNNDEAVPGIPNTWKKWGKYFPELVGKS